MDCELTFQSVFQTWTDIIYDLTNPSGRSVYDAFWQNDRPYYAGMSLIYLGVLLLIVQLVIVFIKPGILI